MTVFSNCRATRAALGAILLAITATAAQAQEGTKPPVPHTQMISGNPFLLMIEWFNVEYEHKITGSTTLGATASTIGIGSVDHTNVNALVRYYPQGAALTGVYLGGRTGVARLSSGRAGGTAMAAGFELGYSVLLGSRRNVGISIGAGLDRLFGGDLQGFTLYRPIAKLNVGFAF